MRTIAVKFAAAFLLSLTIQITNAQKQSTVLKDCPNPKGGQRTYYYVKFFLTFSDKEDARIETGATNEAVEDIQPVADEKICTRLNQIVSDNQKHKSIDENLYAKWAKYYYRTDNLYYIFCDREPEHDNTPNTEPSMLFIVVSTDFENTWEYYKEDEIRLKIDGPGSRPLSSSNAPLFIFTVDNKKIETSEGGYLKDINTDWIKSIDIFKVRDASDLLEQNGVILVNLKRGTFRKMPTHLRRKFKEN